MQMYVANVRGVITDRRQLFRVSSRRSPASLPLNLNVCCVCLDSFLRAKCESATVTRSNAVAKQKPTQVDTAPSS